VRRVELDLVEQLNVVVADQRNLRLEVLPRMGDRVAMNSHENKAASLIEAQCVDIVVAGEKPEPPRILGRDGHQRPREERRTNALTLNQGLKRDDLDAASTV